MMELVAYTAEKTQCIGSLYLPPLKKHHTALNCVIIAHDWGGKNDFALNQAKQLTKQGYAAFAIDVYGNGNTSEDNEQKRAWMTPLLENRSLLAKRLIAAFQAIQLHPSVNAERISVIGYCFGGLCALDMARLGLPVIAAVSIHGLLYPPKHRIAKPILSNILIEHGYDDPLCPPDNLDIFAHEMSMFNARWQINVYGNTKHSFTHPHADNEKLGLAYHSVNSQRSWQNTLNFLEETFNSASNPLP